LGLICVGLDPDSRVVSHTQKIVDNLESLVSRGEINRCDVGDLGILSGSVVPVELIRAEQHSTRGITNFRNVKTGMTPEGGM